ncbi:MAG: TetR/AcrR family transcriptional regulator, partial [Oxalobacter sp.]|nr:TetR/AcrR family transcriptional regulator [Oxalobacter sp.]
MRRRTEEKRNAILKVARELFNEKGYHKTSMSEITEKVGGSKATLYGYFKSKEMLFQAVMADSSLEELRQNVPQSDTPAQVIPAENYRQMIAIIDDLHHSKDDIRK